MSFAVDGVRVQAYSASQLDANWLSSITEQRVEGTPLYPFVVRMMTPLVYDAAGRNLTPGMLQGLVRQARTAGNDGITIKNALGYQGPVFVNLAVDNSRRVDKAPPGSQIRFDRTSPEGQQMATMWETVKDKISLPRVKEALAKMWQVQFWALQMQQLAHVHAAWMPLRMWEETRLKFYRKAAQMHSRADATVRQLQQLGKEQMAQMYKLTLEEYRKMEHWTELVQVDAWHWEHRPTAVLLEKMRAVGIDLDSPSGAQMLQLYLDAKNALQFQQDEMERVLAVLTKHKYSRNPEKLMRALTELRAEAEKGIEAQYRAEVELSQKQLEAERAEAAAFLRIYGLVADRTALAKLESSDLRAEADIAKAKFNRVKTKLQQLNQSQSAIQTQARMVEITYAQAGLIR
jgi:hypothetical protein